MSDVMSDVCICTFKEVGSLLIFISFRKCIYFPLKQGTGSRCVMFLIALEAGILSRLCFPGSVFSCLFVVLNYL